MGSTPYVSKFTGMEEQLPAALGLIGAQGSDIMLADFVEKLFESTDPFIGSPVQTELKFVRSFDCQAQSLFVFLQSNWPGVIKQCFTCVIHSLLKGMRVGGMALEHGD